uniref:APC family permease n=1 Tax=Mycolicibacterium bacteremicum TaxID=564198 RepID=UPI003F581F04
MALDSSDSLSRRDAAAPGDVDAEDFGYARTLHKEMRWFKSAMVALSTTSPATAIFTLFTFGIATGGTAFVWSFAIGFVVMLLVALVFAELGANMPIAGAIYQWASRLGGPKYGYLTGWLYALAQTAILGSLGLAIAPIIGSLFNFVPTTLQASLIAIAVIVVVNVINLSGVQVVSRLTTIGAVAEITVMAGLTILLAVFGFGNQSFDVILHSYGAPVNSTLLGIASAVLLFGSWPYTALEMPTDMAEETHDAARAIPRAGIMNITLTFVVGMLFLLVVLWATPGSLADLPGEVDPLQTVIVGVLNSATYKFFAVIVIVAIVMSMVGNQALTARIIFSLARDKKVPAATALMRTPEKTGVPVLPTTLVAVVSCVLVLFAGALAIIASAAIAALFLAYQMGIWPAVYMRLTNRWAPAGWSLGKAAKPIYLCAAILGTALAVNVGWPRSPELPWFQNWASLIFLIVSFLAAALYYVVGGQQVRAAIDAPLSGVLKGITPRNATTD